MTAPPMPSAQKGMAVEVTELIERLRKGVTALGLGEDNCTELFDITDADEVMHEAAEALAATATAQAEVAALKATIHQLGENAAKAAREYADEVARLREALADIDRLARDRIKDGDELGPRCWLIGLVDIEREARTALASEPGK